MVLDLKRLFGDNNSSVQLNAEFDLSDLEFSGVFPIKTPVKITGEILSKTGIVSLVARVDYSYIAPCDRCCSETEKHYTLNLERTLVTELANEQDIDNEDLILIPDMQFDLGQFVSDEVVLGTPTQHLCREDCKGLCRKCGKNLNEGSCDCTVKEIDPRLSVLQQLLNDD